VPHIEGIDGSCSAGVNWATPAARDWKDNGYPAEWRRNSLGITAQAIKHSETLNGVIYLGAMRGGRTGNNKRKLYSPQDEEVGVGNELMPRLSPRFVEWLMGLPIGWSGHTRIDYGDLERWEIALCHYKHLLLSFLSGKDT